MHFDYADKGANMLAVLFCGAQHVFGGWAEAFDVAADECYVHREGFESFVMPRALRDTTAPRSSHSPGC